MRFVLATTEPHKMPATIVGRCQRFDFRRLTIDGLAELLQKIAGSEGVQLDPGAALAMARQAEGSARDAVSLLDQASVVGGERVDEDVVRSLLGVPQGEIRVEIADVVAVGDLRGAFEAVDRLVQAGHDLRNVTGDLLAHFRNLLVVQAAPDQDDLLDVPSDAYAALRAQADKFTPGELSRVLELLLAAQTDMRWTTSPRLTLELALVRACAPETDPTPAGVVARLERLERLANVAAGVGRARAGRRRPLQAGGRDLRRRRERLRRRLRRSSARRSRTVEHRRGRRRAAEPRSPRLPVAERTAASRSACGRRRERRRRDAPPVVGIGDPAPRPAQAGGAARADGERDADVVRRHHARDRVPADLQEHRQAGGEPRGSVPRGPAGAVRDLAGDLVRRPRVPRRRRRARTWSRSRKTTRPATTPRRCAGCRRCSAPSP